MQGIEVRKAGLYSSIQDVGRRGYRAYGVPPAGAMDQLSASLANRLLNNAKEAAVLEMTLVGPVLQFLSPSRIAISGADLNARLNGNRLPLNKALAVKEGDELAFGQAAYGVRGYLAVQGGFQTEMVLGSRSYYAPLTEQARIRQGDLLPIASATHPFTLSQLKVKMPEEHFSQPTVQAWPGPEFTLLSERAQTQLFSEAFSLSAEQNRMGIRLAGPSLDYPEGFSLLTSAVQAGTVQLTPSGQLIVLMRDAQTTGGYPRVVQLTEAAINRLAQKRSGDAFSFLLKEAK